MTKFPTCLWLLIAVLIMTPDLRPAESSGGANDAPNDITGDGKTDFIIVRTDGAVSSLNFGVNDFSGKDGHRSFGAGQPTTVGWWTLTNDASGFDRVPFGSELCYFMTEDFDGDGKDDLTVWLPSMTPGPYFYILNSSTNTVTARRFGIPSDYSLVVGDWSGDGRADLAVYRPSTWTFYWQEVDVPDSVHFVPWGLNGVYPFALDYDGDGKLDPAFQFSPGGDVGQFWIRQSSDGAQVVFNYGLISDFVVPGDYDGDGRDDICVTRNINFGSGTFKYFFIRESDGGGNPDAALQWGVPGDFVTQGDYDGDGKTDLAVWRFNSDPTMNYFFVRRSSDGVFRAVEWGQQGDYPVNNWNVH